jgi:hypothetical protein
MAVGGARRNVHYLTKAGSALIQQVATTPADLSPAFRSHSFQTAHVLLALRTTRGEKE